MTASSEVLAAAEQRATALAAQDEPALRTLLHPDFTWVSHTGDQFDRERYVRANIDGPTRWHRQTLIDPLIIVVGDAAVLRCVVTDDVTTAGGRESFRMPMTQTWVRSESGWQCLAGHAGPRIPNA